MPSVTLQPPLTASRQEEEGQGHSSPLPPLLHTPLGLAVIEIQGTLNLPTSVTSPITDAQQDATVTQIGRLVFPLLSPADADGRAIGDDSSRGIAEGPWMRKVHLYVGENQRLVGEVRKLKRPLGVLRRQDAAAQAQPGDALAGELQMVDVVKWKLFFGGRPEFV